MNTKTIKRVAPRQKVLELRCELRQCDCRAPDPRHIYAQVIASGDNNGARSALYAGSRFACQATGNVTLLPQRLASWWQSAPRQPVLTSVAFDRSDFEYHGRVKALADAAREGGLEF